VPRLTRTTAVKSRGAALQLLRNHIVSAPEELRDQVRNPTRMQLIRTCAAGRPDTTGFCDPVCATRIALKSLARRILELNDEIADLDPLITTLVGELAPACWPRPGSASRPPGSCSSPPATTLSGWAASRRSRCCAAPRRYRPPPARPNATDSTGRRPRRQHRTAHDRRGPHALLPTHPRYVQRRTTQGKSKREILRCLKRYIARQISHTLHADLAARKLCARAGLIPAVRNSDRTVRHGHITKQGSSAARWVLCEAAQRARTQPPFARFYAECAARRGKQIATVAVARKLLARCSHLLKEVDATAISIGEGHPAGCARDVACA
jgi:hypothetical protein